MKNIRIVDAFFPKSSNKQYIYLTRIIKAQLEGDNVVSSP